MRCILISFFFLVIFQAKVFAADIYCWDIDEHYRVYTTHNWKKAKILEKPNFPVFDVLSRNSVIEEEDWYHTHVFESEGLNNVGFTAHITGRLSTYNAELFIKTSAGEILIAKMPCHLSPPAYGQ